MLRAIIVAPWLLTLLIQISACPASAIEFPSFGLFSGGESTSPSDRPGTKEWWKRHKGKAEFVPGEGYRVPGFEGWYDDKGRPIDAPVDEVSVKLENKLEESSGLIPGLDPKSTAKKLRDAVGLGPNEVAARRSLDEGVAHFAEKEYDKAAADFESAASRWPGTQVASLALFNLGEAYYFDESYDDASDAYVKLLSEHPNTPRLDDAIERLWAIANYWERSYFESGGYTPLDYNMFDGTRPTTDRIGNAIRLYDAIRLNDPTGPRADDAIMATAGIYFKRERFRDADYHYGLLRSEYPRSQYQFEAHLLGLQCKMKVYQGPDYDGTPLDEAKKLEERIRTNFAGRISDDEQSRLRETRATLAALIEERELRMADYYEGTDHFGAARVYYERLIKAHPGSPSAELAQQRLAELGEKPATPPTRMAWFVDLFPTNRHQSAIEEISELGPGAGRTMVAENKDEETTTR